MSRFDRFGGPSWVTAASTGASYLAVLTAVFLVLFALPFVLFMLLA